MKHRNRTILKCLAVLVVIAITPLICGATAASLPPRDVLAILFGGSIIAAIVLTVVIFEERKEEKDVEQKHKSSAFKTR